MWVLPIVAVVTCIAVALRRTEKADVALRISRWTYSVLMPASLVYFAIKSGFRLRPVECEWTFGFDLAVYSLTNFPHMAMFAVFFLLTNAQLPKVRRAMAWSFAACLVMGFLVEVSEGATGIHHCRMRDLIPDMAGASIGALVLIVTRRLLAWRLARFGESLHK